MALLPAVVVVEDQNWSGTARGERRAPGRQLALLHWNVCRGYAGWPRIAAKIAEDPPQLAILSEVIRPDDAEALGKLLPQLLSGNSPRRCWCSPSTRSTPSA